VTTRSYGGQSAEERRTGRRARLLAAACAICGEEGWVAVRLRQVCARAGLTDRYFTESFANRDALLAAVFDQALEEVTISVVRAVAQAPSDREAQLRAAVAAVVAFVAADPHRARGLLGHPGDDTAFEQHRRQALRGQLAGFLSGTDDVAAQVTELVAVGGLIELLNAWLAGDLDVDAEQLVDHATHALLGLDAPCELRPDDV
jgi:AcrR family transcriptional regulator